MSLEKNIAFPNIIVYITENYPTEKDAIIQTKYLKKLNNSTEEIPIRIDLLSNRLLEEFKADNNILDIKKVSYNEVSIGNRYFVYLKKVIENSKDKELIKNYINSRAILNKLKEVKLDYKENNSKREARGIAINISEVDEILDIERKKDYTSEIIKNNSNLDTIFDSLFDISKNYNNMIAGVNNSINNWSKYCAIISTSVSYFKEDTNNLIQVLNKKVVNSVLSALYNISNLESVLKKLNLKIPDNVNKKEILDNFTNYFTLDGLESKVEDLNFNNFLYLVLDILEKTLIDESNIKYINASNKTKSDLNIKNFDAVIDTQKYTDDIEIKYSKNKKSFYKSTDYFTVFLILDTISKVISKNEEQNKQFLKTLNKTDFTEELLFLFEQ
ncbi:MAG TPA: hypothetical protein VJ881_03405 [Halanaerobiales bacterium]|nr:hypothetical protein [Halanaerobiales bacterium]